MPDKFENPILKSVDTNEQFLMSATPPKEVSEDLALKEARPLHLCRKILFGLAAPPLQMTGNICGFFFSLFLLEVVHMSPLLVSVISFSGRAWDAVTDPLVGQLVFRTKTRIGRTKPWLIVATLLGPITFFMMWIYVPGEGNQQFVYYFFTYLAYCALITCYHVPYTSSTVLISNNSKDKDGATASRIGFELIFTIIGSGVFGVIIQQKRLASNCKAAALANETALEVQMVAERHGYMIAAGIISAMYLLCGIFAIGGIRERVKQERQKDSFFKNIRSVLSFGPYLLLMFAFLFMSLGIQIVQANLGLYTTHSMGLGAQMHYGIFTVLSVAVLCVPFWYKMADRFGKKMIFICGLVPMFPCLLFATFMPAKSMFCYYLVCAVSGLSISVAMLMPWSMLPDVIDDFYVKTGDRKESVFYSLYVFFTKFASGVSLALSQLALSASGFDTNACTQPESVGLALRYLVGPGPVLCIAVAMILMWCYPIDKAYRNALNEQLLKKLGCAEVKPNDDVDNVGCDQDEPVCIADCMTSTCTDEVQPIQQEKEKDKLKPQQPTDTSSSGSGGSSGSTDSCLAGDVASTACLLPQERKVS